MLFNLNITFLLSEITVIAFSRLVCEILFFIKGLVFTSQFNKLKFHYFCKSKSVILQLLLMSDI
jgi:hypothetical protein